MKKKRWIWIVVAVCVVLGGCGCGTFSLILLLGSGSGSGGGSLASGDAVAVIEVKGTIASGEQDTSSGAALSGRIISDLRSAIDDISIRAIVLDIDSPGGSVVASADIYATVRDCPKPVVSSFGEVAASGGYYIACPSAAIFARPATLTGSIGVRWEFMDVEQLLQKIGVQMTSIQSGALKDQGSSYRAMTDEERAVYQALVDEAYADFVAAVAEGRQLSIEKVRELADGRVYSGRQGLELGLVDELGNLDDAIAFAAQLGGIEGQPRIVTYEQPASFLDLLGINSRAEQPQELVLVDELLGRRVPKLMALYAQP